MKTEIELKIIEKIKELEEKLIKDIQMNEYFGDSYICGITDRLCKIREIISKTS